MSRVASPAFSKYSALRTRPRKIVGSLEPPRELSIDVGRLLEAYLDMPTVGGRLLPLLDSGAADVRGRLQGEDQRGTPRRNAGERRPANKVYRRLLWFLHNRTKRARRLEEPAVRGQNYAIALFEVRLDVHDGANSSVSLNDWAFCACFAMRTSSTPPGRPEPG